jgi:predicted DCC family thiol-disulfide oxidoreductase YuxK
VVEPSGSAPAGVEVPDRWTLLYDGHCRVCQRAVRGLRRLDRADRVDAVPYQDPATRQRFAWIPTADLERAMHLVSPAGGIWAGAQAVERLLALLPGGLLWHALFRIPLVRTVADRVYRWIARNRHRLGCGAHCSP